MGREVGSAIFLANEGRGIKVNLTKPDVTFYVEVRDKKAYLFSEYQPGPAGLPLGSQGKVVAVVEDERGALAAWMLMKRGCRATILSAEGSTAAGLLQRWDPRLRVVQGVDIRRALRDSKALAAVYGYGLKDMERIKALPSDHPSFFPLVGMTEEEVSARLAAIKTA